MNWKILKYADINMNCQLIEIAAGESTKVKQVFLPSQCQSKVEFMTDVHNSETRSYNMSQIKGKHTKPELLVRKYLWACGYRYRLHDKRLPGKPDIVFPGRKTVIFIHGCFWHGHEGCTYYVVPKTRTEWWLKKISGNKQKDLDNLNSLSAAGWKIIAIFECELKKNKRDHTLSQLVNELH